MIKLFSIGMGGFLGAVLRYWISGWVYSFYRTDFPLGTLLVNIVGSFVLGILVGLSDHHILNPNIRLFMTIGLMGAFTTFSTFSYETVMLLQVNAVGKALLNIFLSLFAGLFAALVGLFLGRLV